MSKDFIAIQVHPAEDGMLEFSDETGKVIALKWKRTVCDLREKNFLATSPCLYCGMFNNKGHIPACHIDPFSGQTITTEQQA